MAVRLVKRRVNNAAPNRILNWRAVRDVGVTSLEELPRDSQERAAAHGRDEASSLPAEVMDAECERAFQRCSV
jgi:hypothetical protein